MNEDLEALGISLDFYFPNKALEQKLKFITEITPEIIELYKGREGIHTLCEALLHQMAVLEPLELRGKRGQRLRRRDSASDLAVRCYERGTSFSRILSCYHVIRE